MGAMKNLSLTLITLLSVLATPVFAESTKNPYHLSTWWRLNGESLDEQDLNSQGENTSFILTMKLTREIGDWAEVIVNPGVKFATGSGQGLIHDKRPKNSLFANEAVFRTKGDRFQVTAGSVNQRHNYARSVVSHLASFPGVMGELFLIKEKTFRTSLRLQAAIPSAYTFSTESTSTESSPRFYTASLDFHGESRYMDNLYFVTTFFSYQDLPQVLAVDSAAEGNTVSLTSSTTGTFHYDFQGVSFAIGGELPLVNDFTVWGNYEYAINFEADDNRNQAKSAYTGVKYHLNKKDSLGLLGIYRRWESDISPAALNWGLSNNNRVTLGARVIYEMEEERLKFIGGYESGDPIYRSSVQANRKVIYLRMESSHDIF